MKQSLVTKTFLLLLFCITLSLYCMSSDSVLGNSSIMIEFNGIQDVYSEHDLIEFELHNSSDDNLFFYCAVEKKIEGHWREVVPSIAATKVRKSVKLSEIAPNQTQRLIWDHSKQKYYPATNLGVFRFKLEIMEHQEKKSMGRVFSKEFEISQQSLNRGSSHDQVGKHRCLTPAG